MSAPPFASPTPTYQQAGRPAAEHPSRRQRLPDLRTRSATRRTEACVHRGAGCGCRGYPAAWWPSGDAAAQRPLRRFSPGSWLRRAGHRGRGSRARRSCPAAWRPSEGRWRNKLRDERDRDRVSGQVWPLNATRSRTGDKTRETISKKEYSPPMGLTRCKTSTFHLAPGSRLSISGKWKSGSAPLPPSGREEKRTGSGSCICFSSWLLERYLSL